MPNSFWPHGLHYARLSCPSLSPRNLLRFTSTESVMLSSHFIFCHSLLFLPSIFPSIRFFVFFFFSNESTLRIRWPKYRSFRFSISPSYTYSGLVPLWLTSLTRLQSPCSPRDSQESSPASQLESINSSPLSLLYGPTLTSIHDSLKKKKIIALTIWTFISKLVSLLFNMLSSFALASLSRSKCFLIS